MICLEHLFLKYLKSLVHPLLLMYLKNLLLLGYLMCLKSHYLKYRMNH